MRKINIYHLLSLVVSISLLSCKERKTNPVNETGANNQTTDTVAPIWGVFQAVLPCADCPGIDTRIFLQKDFTYIKEENYQGIKDSLPHIFYDLGKWTVKDSIITIIGQTSDTFQYKILADQSIKMLAQDGEPMPDSIASHFQFSSKGKTFQTAKPFLVSGILDKTGQDNSLFVCIWNKTVAATLTPQAQLQLDSLWKSLKKPEATKAIIQADALLDTHQENKLLIQKVNTVIDGDNCH